MGKLERENGKTGKGEWENWKGRMGKQWTGRGKGREYERSDGLWEVIRGKDDAHRKFGPGER